MTSLELSKQDKDMQVKATNFLAYGLIAVVLAVSIAAGIGMALGPSNSTEDMETLYDLQYENIGNAIEMCALTEIALSKRKLEDYYAERTELSTEDLERLISKAEGRGLNCRSFQ